jgi:hypothetical protein
MNSAIFEYDQVSLSGYIFFGGYFDEEFSDSTVSFFERLNEEQIEVIISEVLDAELQNAPQHVRDLLNTIPNGQIQRPSDLPGHTYQKMWSEKPVMPTVFILLWLQYAMPTFW